MTKRWIVSIIILSVLIQAWIHLPKENKAFSPIKVKSVHNTKTQSIIVTYKNVFNTFQNGQVLSHMNAEMSTLQQHIIHKKELLPHMEVWELSDSTYMWDLIEALNRHPTVSFAEPDYELTLFWGSKKKKKIDNPPLPAPIDSTPFLSDPRLSEAYGLYKIQAPQSWNIYRGNPEIVVAVIDSGMDYLHEDLSANVWHNPGEMGTYQNENGEVKNKEIDGIDNDGNGFIDDIIGWDFRNNDAFPYDDNHHGTHVAGIIGAVGENGKGSSGVIQNVSIMPLKFTSDKGSGKTSDAIKAIHYAVQNGAKIISNSWGGENFSVNLYQAVQYAQEHGVLFIAAAGNGGDDSRGDNLDKKPIYPAAFDLNNVISVAATNSKDKLELFSNYGPQSVDIGAPGAFILSTSPQNKYEVLSGTSMATPYVAGGAALLLSYQPKLTYQELKNLLMVSVDPLSTLSGKVASQGRLNVFKALQSLSSPEFILTRY
ncbi:MAG: S8 family serine peptidase [Deltaproteobacteria bacterium]|nr:S8 family serine peptidase [Deltaproteobacteria bacterium]